MRKKLISMLLCATMVATVATGCGSSPSDLTNSAGSASSQGSASSAGNASSGGGSGETVKLTVWAAENDQDYLTGQLKVLY